MAKSAASFWHAGYSFSALSLSIVSPASSVRAQAGSSAANWEVYVPLPKWSARRNSPIALSIIGR